MSFVEKYQPRSKRTGRYLKKRALPPFFRSELAWFGKIRQDKRESPKNLKVLAVVFSFWKPIEESRLEPYIDDALSEYESLFQTEDDKEESSYGFEQVAHDESTGLGFYRVEVFVNDVSVRRERLH